MAIVNPTSVIALERQITGTNANVWNDRFNANWDRINAAFTGVSVSVTSGAATLTAADSGTDTSVNAQTRYGCVVATGTPALAATITWPAAPASGRTVLVVNSTAQQVTFMVSGQSGVAVPAGVTRLVRSNGADLVDASPTPAAPGAAGNLLQSDGSKWTTAAPLLPAHGAAGSIVLSDGAKWVTGLPPVWVPAPGFSGNVLQSDGSAWVAIASPLPAPGTAGNILKSNGGVWTSAAKVDPFSVITDVTADRALGSGHITNSGSGPIYVTVSATSSAGPAALVLYINEHLAFQSPVWGAGIGASVMGIVPVGGNYRVDGPAFTLTMWLEAQQASL